MDRAQDSGIVVFVSSELLGRGDDPGLGSLLMQKYLNTLDTNPTRPETIVFMNSGVKLLAEDSPVVEILRRLEAAGIDVLGCGTCLSRYGLADKMGTGQVSDMNAISDILLSASKVISV